MFPLGKIDSTSAFMIVRVKDGVPSCFSINHSNQYYWDEGIPALLSLGIFPVFNFAISSSQSSTSSYQSFSLSDLQNGGGVGLNSTNNTLGNASIGTQLEFASDNEEFKDSLLSLTPYTLSNDGVVVSIYSDRLATTSEPADDVLILPVKFWYDCSGSGGQLVNDQVSSLTSFYNSVLNNRWTPSWVDLNQCNQGVTYQYCPYGNYCGSNNCYGPCSSGVCNYSGTSFSCGMSKRKKTAIVVLVITTIAVIVLVLVMYLMIKKLKK